MKRGQIRSILRGLDGYIRQIQKQMAYKIAEIIAQKFRDMGFKTQIVDESDEEFINIAVILQSGEEKHKIYVGEEDSFWYWVVE